jgi:hypothetical protein
MMDAYPFGGILVAPFVGGYLASLICRFLCQRQKRPGVAVIWVSILASVIATWLATFQMDLFRVSRWTRAKMDMPVDLAVSAIPAVLVALIAARFVVSRYRKMYDRDHPVANPQRIGKD